MKTMYEVLHRPRVDHQAADIAGMFPTLEDARSRTGLTDPSDWRESSAYDSVSLYVTDAAAQRTGRALEWMIVPTEVAETDQERVQLALKMALENGSYDGDHHKMWAIDQIVRILTGDNYDQVIAEWCKGEDGPDTYEWDEGIAP